MKNKFSSSAERALDRALIYAREMGHTYIGSEHLLLGLLSDADSPSFKVLSSSSVTFLGTRSLIAESLGKGARSTISASDMTPRLREIIENSSTEASLLASPLIKSEHLLLALINEKDSTGARLITMQGGELDSIHASLIAGGERSKSNAEKLAKPKKDTPCVTLKYGRDLTALALEKKLDPVIERDAELERIICILSRRIKNNPCLIGDPGVGKTALVEGLAMRICEKRVPDELIGKTIINLDLPSMIAGAKYRGEFEDRMKSVLEEALKNPDVILFIDELHTIIGAGGAEGAIDAANIIKPALARGELRLIGATTTDEYRKHIEKDTALERRFQPLVIKEPSPEDTVRIIKGLREKYEEHHKIKIGDDAILAAVKLSVRYINDRFLPDKAIDLIDETASYLRLKKTEPSCELLELRESYKQILEEKELAVTEGRFEDAAGLRDGEISLKEKLDLTENRELLQRRDELFTVSALDIARTVSLITGIPTVLSQDEEKELLSLEEKLKKHIIGQDAAIKTVSNAIRRARAGLSDSRRPIASFIFLGPPGTGKTSLASLLSKLLFRSQDSLIRLDMSEYMEKHSLSRLVGAPPGYIGYESGGILTDRIRRHPYSVCLFDEIEKAHPDILGILLQILEEGSLTSADKRICDFSNAVIILTSNIGYERISSFDLGFASSKNDLSKSAEKNLSRILKPELLGRIDDIIVFRALEREDLLLIAQNVLEKIRLKALEIGITLIFDGDVADIIAEKCIEEKNARPIRQSARQLVENPLSRLILEKSISSGDTVRVFSQKDNSGSLGFEKAAEG